MLSAGVLALLAVRRRRRLRQAEPHARLPEPTFRQVTTERELRLGGAGERLARVDLAVRAAALSLIVDECRVLAVLCSPEGEVELISDGPTALPPPWKGGGDRWSLAASAAAGGVGGRGPQGWRSVPDAGPHRDRRSRARRLCRPGGDRRSRSRRSAVEGGCDRRCHIGHARWLRPGRGHDLGLRRASAPTCSSVTGCT